MNKDFWWIQKLEKKAKKALTATVNKEKLRKVKATPLKLEHPTLDKILQRKLEREGRGS